jgi:hypothetical protein
MAAFKFFYSKVTHFKFPATSKFFLSEELCFLADNREKVATASLVRLRSDWKCGNIYSRTQEYRNARIVHVIFTLLTLHAIQ